MASQPKAGTVTYRQSNTGEVQVLLITASTGGSWILPMGKVKSGESPADAAARETREEAGVRVEIGPHVGDLRWEDLSGQPQVATFYLAEYVADVEWEESYKRRRRWVRLEDALQSELASDFRPIVAQARQFLAPGSSGLEITR